MLPEWMPNLHPMVVHFPIALIIVAFAVDVVALFFRKISMLPRMSTILYVLGALGAVGSVVSGEAAVETVAVSGQASSILANHEDVGEIVMYYFLIYSVLRLALWWFSFRLVFWVPLTIIGAIGLIPLYQASSFGGRLVYEQGVGVAMVDSMAIELEEKERALLRMGMAQEFSGLGEDGAWQWRAGENAVNTFNAAFETVMGQVVADTVRDSEGNYWLALSIVESPAMITYGIPVVNVELLAEMDLSDFDGSTRLLHHVTDSFSYHFMEVEDGMIRLGVSVDGEIEIEEETSLSQPLEVGVFRVVGDQTHFRGYFDGDLAVHGHGLAPATGVTGFAIFGSGTIKLARMQMTVLQ
ncbi:MAG: hypothetical protein F4199_05220 [Rhodothermaceae bacterium]|nr:hypothetical protein [Rhodothermaceae bacterium]